MAPVPAAKKVWIYDGSIAQFPNVFAADGETIHYNSCTSCHGGDATQDTREEAHAATAAFQAVPGADTCDGCHGGFAWVDDTVDTAVNSLHTTLGGYLPAIESRGFDTADGDHMAAFDAKCNACHTANRDGETACGFCHVSTPQTAGGGLLAGHAFQKRPSMDNNCTACHGSRVKDEYYGLNNELLERNKAAFAADSPWADEDYALQPDVHKDAGMDCVSCHPGSEMHGEGAPAAGGNRYGVTSGPRCEYCHGEGKADQDEFAGVFLHSEEHLNSMSCQVCHSQPYKNCFECHVEVSDTTGAAYFTINGSDPTLSESKTVPDALMSFRIGPNPNPDRPYTYAVLRHVPTDADTFAGVSGGAVSLDNVAAEPLWKYATPHNIRRNTPVTASCDNCHLSASAKYWLNDPVADAEGWVGEAYAADETAPPLVSTNAPVLISADLLQAWMDQGLVNAPLGSSDRVVLLDARKASNAAQYLPGAQLWDVGAQVATREDGPAPAVNMVLDGASMDAMLQSHGIDLGTTVVITSAESATYFPSRAYFLLRYWGFPREQIKVLNGYNGVWDAADMVDTPATAAASMLSVADIAGVRADERASLSEMILAVRDGTALAVDFRGNKGAAGSTGGVFSDVGGDYVVFEGIPTGGKSFVWKGFNLDYDGGDLRFKSAAEIEAALNESGIDDALPVITYCRTGYIASAAYFVLDGILGWETMAFDGSWSLWGKLSTDVTKGGMLPAELADWATDGSELMEVVNYNADADSDPNTAGVQPYVIESLYPTTYDASMTDPANFPVGPEADGANQVEDADIAYAGGEASGDADRWDPSQINWRPASASSGGGDTADTGGTTGSTGSSGTDSGSSGGC